MEPICPLLTLGGDPRVVSGAPDAAHRCSAGRTLAPIDRGHQMRFCLGGEYELCARLRTHVAEVGPVEPAWSPAAPDATFASTRLIAEPTPRAIMQGQPRRLGRAVLIVAAILAGGAIVAWLALGGLDRLPGFGQPSPTPSAGASTSPESSETVTEPASPSAIASPTPTPAPTPPAPTPVTYVVQAGDTLNAIAARYGTTAQAIMEANQLTSEIIQVGQVLIIPVP